MPDRIVLDIVTPERLVLREEVDEVLAPGADGDFGVLPGHCEFLTVLRAGELRYQVSGRSESLLIEGGFAEVRENRVIVLADRIGQSGERDQGITE
jgi:F-type H+-transporting ATPase subunit epsilon